MKNKLTLPANTKVPNHVAIILDGNRRWARARGLEPWKGHAAGYEAVKKLGRASRDLGVHTFTVWAFSTENWDRPKREIDEIFKLFKSALSEMASELKREKVRFVHLGNKNNFSKDLRDAIIKLEEDTKGFDKHLFNLAADYGGRDEIIRATKKIISDGVSADEITEELFAKYLDTSDQPYPYIDLFIRTSGEQRTSGLLPWQMTFAEYFWEEDPLPEFTPEKLKLAILDYSRRRRRFGGNDKEKHLQFDPEVSAKLELAWWRLRKVPEGTRLRDFAFDYIKDQYGLSKNLAKEATKYFIQGVIDGDKKDWKKAGVSMHKFYALVKKQLKLAFEPKLVASLRVKLWKEMGDKGSITEALKAEAIARDYYAEAYRISHFQAAKAAHLRVLADIEMNLAENGAGEHHWKKAEDYLQQFYTALGDRVA